MVWITVTLVPQHEKCYDSHTMRKFCESDRQRLPTVLLYDSRVVLYFNTIVYRMIAVRGPFIPPAILDTVDMQYIKLQLLQTVI
jgi:hypothetical protein